MDKVLTAKENHGTPALRSALVTMISRIAREIPDRPDPVRMFLAGGLAINLYTGARPTRDVDASFSRRILLPPPPELIVPYEDADGNVRSLYFDTNYNTTFAVMHENHEDDSWVVEMPPDAPPQIELRILAPVDLAVSKLARFAPNDRGDIRSLAEMRLLTAQSLEQRANEALAYYVGRPQVITANLQDALNLVRDALGSED